LADLDGELRDDHAFLDVVAHGRIGEIEVDAADRRLDVRRVLHAAFAPEREGPRRAPEENFVEQAADGPRERKGHDVEAAERRAHMIEKELGARLRKRIDADEPLAEEAEAAQPVRFQQRLGQELIARLFLEPAALAARRLLARALPILVEPLLQRLGYGGRGQQAALGPQAQQICAGDAAAQRALGVAGRRFPAGAALGVGAAGTEGGGAQGIRELALGVRPRAGEAIET
jgi:hypothetical protein